MLYLRFPLYIIGIKIQSRGDYAQWIKTFRVKYSTDYSTWTNAKNVNNSEVGEYMSDKAIIYNVLTLFIGIEPAVESIFLNEILFK